MLLPFHRRTVVTLFPRRAGAGLHNPVGKLHSWQHAQLTAAVYLAGELAGPHHPPEKYLIYHLIE